MLRPILCYTALAIFLAGCNPPRALPFDEDMGADASEEMPPAIDETPDAPSCVDATTDCAEQPNATATCEAGACQYSCAQGWGDPEGLAATQGCLCDIMTEACGVPYCGNGATEGEEGCDNGALNDDETPDACRTSCQLASCGDGVQDTGELCDDGNDDNTDDCTTECTLCGNGRLDPGEECDDGGVPARDGDGCSTQCVVERYWGCTRDEPSTCWPWLVDYAQPPNPDRENAYLNTMCVSNTHVFVSGVDEAAIARGQFGRNKVMVFSKEGRGFELEQVLRPDDLDANADTGFGASLGCSDEYLLIGAPGTEFEGSKSGRVYVYNKSVGWDFSGIIVESQGDESFGYELGVDGRYAAVASMEVYNGVSYVSGVFYYSLNDQVGEWDKSGRASYGGDGTVLDVGYLGGARYYLASRTIVFNGAHYEMPSDITDGLFVDVAQGGGRLFASYSSEQHAGGVVIYDINTFMEVGRIDIPGFGLVAGGLIYLNDILYVGVPEFFEGERSVGRVYKVEFDLSGVWSISGFYRSPVKSLGCRFGRVMQTDGDRIFAFTSNCDSFREASGAVFIIDTD